MTDTNLLSLGEMTKAWAERAGLEVWYTKETQSTNAVAKEDIGSSNRSALAPVLYLTDHQTQGRGRGKNTWTDSSGALLSSWSFQAARPPQPIFAPLAGLAVFRALVSVWPNQAWSMKAPNDIYLNDKKIAGLLIETVEAGDSRRTIIGLGMNVFTKPSGVEAATCLAEGLGFKIFPQSEWTKFLQKLLISFISALNAGQNMSLLQNDSQELLDALNRRPSLPKKITKIGPQGELHTEDGVIRWQDL